MASLSSIVCGVPRTATDSAPSLGKKVNCYLNKKAGEDNLKN